MHNIEVKVTSSTHDEFGVRFTTTTTTNAPAPFEWMDEWMKERQKERKKYRKKGNQRRRREKTERQRKTSTQFRAKAITNWEQLLNNNIGTSIECVMHGFWFVQIKQKKKKPNQTNPNQTNRIVVPFNYIQKRTHYSLTWTTLNTSNSKQVSVVKVSNALSFPQKQ